MDLPERRVGTARDRRAGGTSVRHSCTSSPSTVLACDDVSREAYEECGVVGTVRCALGGEFRSGPSRSGRVTRVQAFLVDVDNLLDDWPERSVRARRLVRLPRPVSRLSNVVA